MHNNQGKNIAYEFDLSHYYLLSEKKPSLMHKSRENKRSLISQLLHAANLGHLQLTVSIDDV